MMSLPEAARIDAKIKGAHDARYPDCQQWGDYQSTRAVNGKGRLEDGFGCQKHHVWIAR